MDVRTDMIGSWEPMAREWGTTAYEETKIQFVELVLGSAQPRPQAFALWALSHDPSLEGDSLMSFGGGCGNDRPSPDHIEKARNALGFSTKSASAPVAPPTSTATSAPTSVPTSVPTSASTSEATHESEPTKAKKPKQSGARKASKQLSSMEKAILANFKDANKLISVYKKAQSGLNKAEKELEKAAAALRDIDKDKAKLLGQFDAAAEAVLRELGILGDGGTGDSWSL